ncbi:DUF1702 family protein [Cohnella soli]|uniref:DUF1702 family protein n=1 Tax=Cohnella soli TaxID=425005 RepID=A0ABW0I3Q5_9BACL
MSILWLVCIPITIIVVSFPLIYLRLFVVNIRRMQQRFQVADGTLYSKRFPLILRAFLTGNNCALRLGGGIDHLRSGLDDKFEDFYRGFAYEGTGMGFGAKASLLPSAGKRFENSFRKLDPNYLYQYYVGLGWFLQIRFGFRFRGYRKWLQQLDPRYAPIVFDGVGFKIGLFSYSENKQITRKFNHFPWHFQRVCYQGMGRAIWFICGFDLDKAIAEIQYLPYAFRGDAYSGLGLAVAYSMFDNLSFALRSEDQVPSCYRTAFRQGQAFGWEARQLQNPVYWQAQLDKYMPSVAIRARQYVFFVHQARDQLDCSEAVSSDHYYLRWMDDTRSLLDRLT